MSAVLIDTNILVYAHDNGEYEKQTKAQLVLAHLHDHANGRLSVQCLSEFFNIVTRGRMPKLPVPEAARQVQYLAQAFSVFPLTPQVIFEAIRGVQTYQMAFWDAQIWASARLNQVEIVFSEDFNVGASLEGIRFVNPFQNDFAIGDWV